MKYTIESGSRYLMISQEGRKGLAAVVTCEHEAKQFQYNHKRKIEAFPKYILDQIDQWMLQQCELHNYPHTWDHNALKRSVQQ